MHCGPPNQTFGWAMAHVTYIISWLFSEWLVFRSAVFGSEYFVITGYCGLYSLARNPFPERALPSRQETLCSVSVWRIESVIEGVGHETQLVLKIVRSVVSRRRVASRRVMSQHVRLNLAGIHGPRLPPAA